MDFDMQPFIQGERLLLKPLAKADFDALFAAASDPLIWEQHPSYDRYKREIFKEFFEKALLSKGALSVSDAIKNSIIGTSRYYDVDPDLKQVAIGFTFLTREYWGGVYNQELKRLMLGNAFKYFDSALFHIGQFNMRSQKALLKIGGIQEPGISSDGHLTFRIDKKNYR